MDLDRKSIPSHHFHDHNQREIRFCCQEASINSTFCEECLLDSQRAVFTAFARNITRLEWVFQTRIVFHERQRQSE